MFTSVDPQQHTHSECNLVVHIYMDLGPDAVVARHLRATGFVV